jgi:hypothetical protein
VDQVVVARSQALRSVAPEARDPGASLPRTYVLG